MYDLTVKLGSLFGRILLAIIFFVSGINKVWAFENTAKWMKDFGVPEIFLPVVIAFEILAAIALVIGWRTQIAALLMAGFCILTAVIFHSDFESRIGPILFMKNLAIAGGFLILAVNGPGYFSLDNRREATQQRRQKKMTQKFHSQIIP